LSCRSFSALHLRRASSTAVCSNAVTPESCKPSRRHKTALTAQQQKLLLLLIQLASRSQTIIPSCETRRESSPQTTYKFDPLLAQDLSFSWRSHCNTWWNEVDATFVVTFRTVVPSTIEQGPWLASHVELDGGGYIPINHHCQSNIGHIYAAGDVSGKLPLSSVASMQGRKIAEHVMGLHTREHRHLDYEKAASAIFTEPEIADVGLAEAEAFATGRKIRVTKVPFSANAKALINDQPRGFVKILSDPNTGVVLGGSIVGRHAAELISVIALAVTCNLKVTDIVESVLVHPSLSESLADAAE